LQEPDHFVLPNLESGNKLRAKSSSWPKGIKNDKDIPAFGGLKAIRARTVQPAKKQESRWAFRRSGSSHLNVGLTGLLNPTW